MSTKKYLINLYFDAIIFHGINDLMFIKYPLKIDKSVVEKIKKGLVGKNPTDNKDVKKLLDIKGIYSINSPQEKSNGLTYKQGSTYILTLLPAIKDDRGRFVTKGVYYTLDERPLKD